VRSTCALVETFSDNHATGVHDHGTHAWVGVAEGSARGEVECTTHQRDVALALWRVDLTVSHVLPLVLDSCSGELRGANGEHGS